MPKRSKKPKRASLLAAERALAQTLARTGYTASKKAASTPAAPRKASDFIATYSSRD